jgi:threonine dehydratase
VRMTKPRAFEDETTTSVDMIAVLAARRRIASWIRRTPLVRSSWLSAACGADVRMKLESLQVTHSFKARGAFNAALMLREGAGAGPRPRLVTASSGNHGRALAHAAQVLGLECVVFAPADTPMTKLRAIREAGAELRADAPDYDEAETAAKAFAAEQGAAYVSPYADPRIVAATGTIGLEIVEDHPDVEFVLVPLGGGGLVSGMATALKAIRPDIRVIGVEAELNPAFHTIRAQGRMATIPLRSTLAEALGGNVDPSSLTIDLVERLVDDIVLVGETDIATMVADLVEHEHLVAEGAGAIAAAAIAAKRLDVRGRNAVVVVSGGNIDRSRLAALLAPDGARRATS